MEINSGVAERKENVARNEPNEVFSMALCGNMPAISELQRQMERLSF